MKGLRLNCAWMAVGVVVLALALPNMADAKRLGGGSSVGRSATYSKMPAKPMNNTTQGAGQGAAQGAAQTTTSKAQAAQTAQAAQAGQAAKRNWLGPVMGLAAGLGLAALFSSMGLGAGLAQVFSVLLMALAAVAVVVMLMRFLRRGQGPALAGAGAGGHSLRVPQVPVDHAGSREVGQGRAYQQAQAQDSEGFDSVAFLKNAKQFFLTLQGLNDAGDWQTLRRYCSEPLWQHFVDEGQARLPGHVQHTEVMQLEAEVLNMHYEGAEQVAVVSYTALLREDDTSLPQEIHEVWLLARPQDASSGWVLVGIQAS